jgi:hypothetical protein
LDYAFYEHPGDVNNNYFARASTMTGQSVNLDASHASDQSNSYDMVVQDGDLSLYLNFSVNCDVDGIRVGLLRYNTGAGGTGGDGGTGGTNTGGMELTNVQLACP